MLRNTEHQRPARRAFNCSSMMATKSCLQEAAVRFNCPLYAFAGPFLLLIPSLFCQQAFVMAQPWFLCLFGSKLTVTSPSCVFLMVSADIERQLAILRSKRTVHRAVFRISLVSRSYVRCSLLALITNKNERWPKTSYLRNIVTQARTNFQTVLGFLNIGSFLCGPSQQRTDTPMPKAARTKRQHK